MVSAPDPDPDPDLPDVRIITISLDVDGDCDPALDYEGMGDFEALGVLTVVTDRLRAQLGATEDDDDDE